LFVWILGGQKTSDSILEKKWPSDDSNVKHDPYEKLVLAYNMEMD
jgi:hypothetical protein